MVDQESSKYQNNKHPDVDGIKNRTYFSGPDNINIRASKTLYVSNLNGNTVADDLSKIFGTYGQIDNIQVKRSKKINDFTKYAYVEFIDIDSAVNAFYKLRNTIVEGHCLVIKFSKSYETDCVWVAGVSESVDKQCLVNHFKQYGSVTGCSMDRARGLALIFFKRIEQASNAIHNTEDLIMKDQQLQVDFASRTSQKEFFQRKKKTSNKSSTRIYSNDQEITDHSSLSKCVVTTEKEYPYDPGCSRSNQISISNYNNVQKNLPLHQNSYKVNESMENHKNHSRSTSSSRNIYTHCDINIKDPRLKRFVTPNRSSNSSNLPSLKNGSNDIDVDGYTYENRTLCIDNLNHNMNDSYMRNYFQQYGDIIRVKIEKDTNNITNTTKMHALIHYVEITSVLNAIRSMNGKWFDGNIINLRFGKSSVTTCIWIGGVDRSVDEEFLLCNFNSRFDNVSHCVIDRSRKHALVYFKNAVNAKSAIYRLRGSVLKGKQIQVDFASSESQREFYEHLYLTRNLKLDDKDQLSSVSTNCISKNVFDKNHTNRLFVSCNYISSDSLKTKEIKIFTYHSCASNECLSETLKSPAQFPVSHDTKCISNKELVKTDAISNTQYSIRQNIGLCTPYLTSNCPSETSPASDKTQHSSSNYSQHITTAQNCITSPSNFQLQSSVSELTESRLFSIDSTPPKDPSESILTKQNDFVVNEDADLRITKDLIKNSFEMKKDSSKISDRSTAQQEYINKWLYKSVDNNNETINKLVDEIDPRRSRHFINEKVLLNEQTNKQKLFESLKETFKTFCKNYFDYNSLSVERKSESDLTLEELTKPEKTKDTMKTTGKNEHLKTPYTIINDKYDNENIMKNETDDVLWQSFLYFQEDTKSEETRREFERLKLFESMSNNSDIKNKKELINETREANEKRTENKFAFCNQVEGGEKKENESISASNEEHKIPRLKVNDGIKCVGYEQNLQELTETEQFTIEKSNEKYDVRKVKKKMKDKRDKEKSSSDENDINRHENSKRSHKHNKYREDAKLHPDFGSDFDDKFSTDEELKKVKCAERNISNNTSSIETSSKRKMSESTNNLNDYKRFKSDTVSNCEIQGETQKNKNNCLTSANISGKNKELSKQIPEIKKSREKKETKKISKTSNIMESEAKKLRKKKDSSYKLIEEKSKKKKYNEEKHPNALTEQFNELRHSRMERERKKKSASADKISDSKDIKLRKNLQKKCIEIKGYERKIEEINESASQNNDLDFIDVEKNMFVIFNGSSDNSDE